ncbi:ubiquitin carboxyl-terminal hydrolase 47-like isoform X4 [Portunus trituberculatus]|uniref:ubiquitin carboxyl-terminal hydrolase 47-like isoform X4 n=1 Tax=Portunus trituberculatus TaxID=210409 RepID=UPI001E1CDAFA|nr:ubiquitin carboxyl-terminal hydrolase 47-like isoform X4 [Portunus trituberculatus]
MCLKEDGSSSSSSPSSNSSTHPASTTTSHPNTSSSIQSCSSSLTPREQQRRKPRKTESVEDGGGGSSSGGGDGGGGGSGGGGGGGAADRSTSGRSGGSSSGGGGTTSVAEEASTKVARVNAGSSTVQESSMAETTTTSRFSTATTKVKTIKIVKKTSPLIASAISDLNSRAEASLGGATPRRPLAGGSKKVVRSIKIQQETPTTTKTSNKDVSKANDGKVIDVKVKETKVEVVKVCDSNSKETSAAGLSTSSAVSSENTQEVPSKAVTVGNAQLSEIEASNSTGKVIPIIRKASPGPKQPSKVGTTGKASKSLNNAKEALRPKRQSSPLSKTEESVQTSQDAPQTERTRLPSESEKVAVEPSLNSTATENPENSKVATVSSSASVSSSSSVSSSASTASVSSNKTVKAVKVKKPAKTKKQESTEVAPDDTTTTTTTTSETAASERLGQKKEKVTNDLEGKASKGKDDSTKDKVESDEKIINIENGLETKAVKPSNESCVAEAKDNKTKNESKETDKDIKSKKKESKASCDNVNEKEEKIENDTSTSKVKEDEAEKETSEKIESKDEVNEVTTLARKGEGIEVESKAEDIRLTNGETGEHENNQEQQQQQHSQEKDVTPSVTKVPPAIPPPPPPPPPQSPKKNKPIGKVKARKAVTTEDNTTEDSQTSVQEATAVPEISVSGAAAASGDMPKIDINGEGEGNGEEDIPVTKRESGAVADWDPKDTEEPELDSVCVVVRDMSGYNASVNQVTLAMSTQSTCGQLMAEVGRRFKYDPDSFSLVLQCSNGEQVEVEKMEAERALAHARFRIEGSARNNLILCDLGGHPPRQTDDDDLTLGASASPSIVTIPPNSILNAALERSIISYDTPATTSDYSSYSSPLIKHDSGFVGLVNQAMTCYLNSLLQTLFMTPEFRNALYQWEFKGSEEEASKNIPCQLQRLFLQLQTTTKSAVETTKLTRSFGWDSSEAWQQHDIQELCRVMFDALEQCFKNTHQSDLINTLYEGKMKDYVKCLECGNERAREDTYLDIPLPIRPFGSTSAYKSVEEALRAFVSPEVLTGNNQYKCSRCDALCDAHKGLKFTRFPYLLTIHLMRFDFDYQTLHRIKLNDKVIFPDVLDLNHFVDGDAGLRGEEGGDKPASGVDDSSTTDSGSALDAEDASLENTSASLPESDNQEEDEGIDVSSSSAYNNERNRSWGAASGGGPYMYQLFSIMVHSGSASGGHYYAYIKDFTSGEWYCFNDQSVTKITYDDIRKTYGGSGSSRSGGYYSSWSYSANAYMLMYRQVDRERNVYSLTTEEFPQHITDLIKRMSEEEAAEREQRELERSTCRIKLFCRIPGQSQMVERKLRVHKYSTLTDTTLQAYKELGLENIVPLERCRLVKYEEFHESLESSFEGQENEPMYEVLGGVRTSYKFDLLMEIRDEDKQFEVYKPGGTTIKAYVVNLSTEEVEGPFTLRGSLCMTVQDLKEMLGRSLDLNHETMRVVFERYYNDLRPLTSDIKTLKMEGFYRSNKVYVEASGEEAVDFFTGSQMYSILDRYENTITLYCPLPDTSPEALEELQIPPYKEEVVEATAETEGPCGTVTADELTTPPTTTTTTTTAVATETSEITSSSAPPPASSPAESAASPASCSSKDSGISSKGGITDTGSSSDGSGTISRGSSLVSPTSSSSSSSPTTSTSSPSSSSSSSSPSSVTQQTSPQQQHLPSPSPLAVNTITTITCATPSSTPTASPTAASTTLVLGNCSDGEDEGIADADSGTGSSHVNSDQSASEDSSLTSDSDRTLVGEPPEDRLSDTSNSPDYHNVSPPTDPVGAAAAATSATTAEAKGGDETGGGWGLPIFQDTDGAWGDDEKATPELKRYFRAEYFTEEDTGARMLRVWVDKRITIGQLKQEMQRWVGVSQDHFKLYKIYSNSQEFECTRMTESLTSYADNTRLSVRLGRALLPGEHRGKVYLLEPHNFEDPSKFLIDWVVRKGDTVANAKRAIVREVNARCPGMNLVPERVRLRKKSWKTPQAIYLDQHKFDDDITLFSNWELFLQVLDGPEQKTANVDELAIFVKRWRPSSHTTDPLTEIIIPEPTTSALRAKLSEVSEIPAENVEFAKGKGTFPCDMSVLDIPSELDWTPRTGQLDQRPLYIMDDGAMIYYRDKTEVVKELTEEQRRDLAVSENQRLNRESQYCPSSSFTPSTSSYSSLRSREKGLKIYLNHDD